MALTEYKENMKKAVELTTMLIDDDSQQEYIVQPLSTAPSWGKLFFIPNAQIVVGEWLSVTITKALKPNSNFGSKKILIF